MGKTGLAPYLSRWEKLDNFINRPVKIIIGDKEIFGISRGIGVEIVSKSRISPTRMMSGSSRSAARSAFP